MTLAAGNLRTTRIERAADLEAHREKWRALACQAPMRSPEWLLTWWEQYATAHDQLCVLLFSDAADNVVGLAPLYLEVRNGRRTLRLLGCEAWTTHSTWLAAAGYQLPVGEAVAAFLLENRELWQCLRLDAVDAGDPTLDRTVEVLAEHGLLVHSTALHNCWKIELPDSWDDYLMMLSKSHRKRCRKLQRDYFDSGAVEVHRVTSQADFQRGFQILLDLHAARWGEPRHPLGCFSDPRYRAFHETAARRLLDRNQLLLVWLEYQGKPVAVEYQLTDGITVYSYQAGMDPELADFPPGNLSLLASIRYAITQGCRWFDLSSGDQPYKANWRAESSPCHDLRIWPAGLSGRLQHSAFSLRDRIELRRLQAVRWVKGKLPPSVIDGWRELVLVLGGGRLKPRKMRD